jgi:hypothetical protein
MRIEIGDGQLRGIMFTLQTAQKTPETAKKVDVAVLERILEDFWRTLDSQFENKRAPGAGRLQKSVPKKN